DGNMLMTSSLLAGLRFSNAAPFEASTHWPFIKFLKEVAIIFSCSSLKFEGFAPHSRHGSDLQHQMFLLASCLDRISRQHVLESGQGITCQPHKIENIRSLITRAAV